MATSTNYGWSEPDNTSLVKDGAQAMRTLGNAIDTSLWNSGYGQAGKNKIINGDFSVWQRGTSITPTVGQAIYTADRWQSLSGTAATTIARQGAAGTGYYARVQRNSGQTGTAIIYLGTTLESLSTVGMIGQTVSYSVKARKGTNFSATSNVLNLVLVYGTGTDQNLFTGLTGQTIVASTAATLTADFQTFSCSGTVPSNATQLAAYVYYTPVGTAGAADYFEIDDVQLEVGAKATPFQTASGGSIQNELAMCQRYYERIVADAAYGFIGNGYAFSTTAGYVIIPFKTNKRIAPSVMDTSAAGTFQFDDGATGYTPSALAISTPLSNTNFGALQATGTSGMTQYRPALFVAKNSSTAFIGFSAEL